MLYLLPAVAGLSGGTLRIPNSFMVAVSGGRNVVALTTLMLMPSMVLAAIGLADANVDFGILVIAAALSGVGGGAFASSMSNISFFYPKRLQGYALGINGGLGNLGVSLTQLFCPLMMGYAAFGGAAINQVGKPTWVMNGPLFWCPFLVIGLFAAWTLMSNMPQHGDKTTTSNVNKYFRLELPALGAAALAVITLFATRKQKWAKTEGGAAGRVFLLVFIAAAAEHIFMYTFAPPEVKTKLRTQFMIFKDKHTYIMTVIYTMCFGSFIGYSGAFPKLIIDIFGYLPNGDKNPNAPDALAFAWLGPFVGSLIRPVGGILADKYGGAVCTQVCVTGMILFVIIVAQLCTVARESPSPEEYFPMYLISFLFLFLFSGAMNGTTFRSIALIFPPEKAGPVLGWSSAIASYGAFIIPALVGLGIKARKVENPFYGLCGYYALCFVLNFWYYARRGAEKPC
jgi:NNP family nitrate/nitrite transporter-like MFS transporter